MYETKYKSNYTKHLKTKKHIKLSSRVTDDFIKINNPVDINELINGFYKIKKHNNISYKEKTDEIISRYNYIYKSIYDDLTLHT